MSADQIRALVQPLGDIAIVLRTADPADEAEVYCQLSVRLTYQHPQRPVRAEADIRAKAGGAWSVSEGGLEPPRPVKGTSTSS
jgi:site-specific DNA recombinase